MKRFCFALDLKDDPVMINEYVEHHKHVWPEILESIKASGIERLDIYHVADRLFMIMETEDSFSLDKKAGQDQNNAKVLKWERLMSNYQKALPTAKEGEKWMLMTNIFELE